MPQSYQEIEDALAKIGSAAGKTGGLVPITNSRSLQRTGSGACRGACLDWLRRFLQGRGAGYNREDRVAQRAILMSAVNELSINAVNRNFDDVQDAMNRQADLAESLQEKRDELWEKVAGDTTGQARAAWQAKRTETADAIALYDSKKTAYQQLTADSLARGRLMPVWGQVSMQLDARLADEKARRRAARATPSSPVQRPFAPAAGRGIRAVDGNAGQWTDEQTLRERVVASLKQMAASPKPMCGILSGYPGRIFESTAEGHAIALAKGSANDWFLYDPNLGIFTAGSEGAAVKTALGATWLFWNLYRDCTWLEVTLFERN